MYDTSDTGNYGHNVHFWFGGEGGHDNQAGYDFDKNVFFLQNDSNAFKRTEVPYELSFGEWHQLMFKVSAPGQGNDHKNDNWVKIYIDGEEVLSYSNYYDTAYYLPTPEEGDKKDYCIIRDFGVAADIDNFGIATLDYDTKEIADISGDGKISTKDVKLLKLYFVDKVELSWLEEQRADIDGNGSVNTGDLIALKALMIS